MMLCKNGGWRMTGQWRELMKSGRRREAWQMVVVQKIKSIRKAAITFPPQAPPTDNPTANHVRPHLIFCTFFRLIFNHFSTIFLEFSAIFAQFSGRPPAKGQSSIVAKKKKKKKKKSANDLRRPKCRVINTTSTRVQQVSESSHSRPAEY